MLLLSVGIAQAADRKIPIPRLKPDKLSSVPIPRLKPAKPEATAVAAPNVAFPPITGSASWPKDIVLAERSECAQRLMNIEIVYEPMASLGSQNGCGAPAPLLVTAIAGVKIVPAAELTCDMAEALHGWIASSALPAAREHLKKKLVTINNASAYVCRRRNNSKTGKLSEHAKANALDISTLGFGDGSSSNIKGDWSGLKQFIGMSAQGNFLRQIRRDACIRFTTVLGPGSDPYHGDHFHIDVVRRKNGYRICQ